MNIDFGAMVGYYYTYFICSYQPARNPTDHFIIFELKITKKSFLNAVPTNPFPILDPQDQEIGKFYVV